MGRRRERSGKWREILLEIPKIDNGSIMRLAPVVLAFPTSPSEAIAMAARSSRTTHGARDAVDGCRRATVRAGPAIGRRLQFGGSRGTGHSQPEASLPSPSAPDPPQMRAAALSDYPLRVDPPSRALQAMMQGTEIGQSKAEHILSEFFGQAGTKLQLGQHARVYRHPAIL